DYNGCGSPGNVSSFHVEEPSSYPSNTYTHAGNGYQMNESAYAGAHDLNNVDPAFEDPTRNFGTWYTAGLGNASTGTYAGDVAAAHTWISQAAQTTGVDSVKERIQRIYNWIVAGWAPTNDLYNFTSPGDANSVQNLGAVKGVFKNPPGFVGP